MKPSFALVLALCSGLFPTLLSATPPPPNILFIIADDASRHFGQAYACDWVKTPHIDRLAQEGLTFDNAYAPTSKCAPCRAAILTGRNPWQLEAAGNHQAIFPARFTAATEALQVAGLHTGSTGKTWGPGIANDAEGNKRLFGLPPVTAKAPSPGEKLSAHLQTRPENAPFFFWFGSSNPHRAYQPGAGLAAGKKLSDIDHVPAYWPDHEIVRSDMLDYATEIESFDEQVGSLLEALEASGLAQNTLVIVTSDHGMPFPRVKGHTYDDAHRIPLVLHWPAGIRTPGRRVSDLVSLIDLAPTFLELYGIDPAITSMEPITGVSLTDILSDEPARDRPFVIIGRERNDVFARPGTPHGLGYPARGIRSGDFLYIHNFAPDRWPCGNPDIGLKDTDNSPTKQLLIDLGPGDPYWEHSFGLRPAQQLFHLPSDPGCVQNLASDPQHTATLTALHDTLLAELHRQEDPRVLGQGDFFEQQISAKTYLPGWESGATPPERKPRRPAP